MAVRRRVGCSRARGDLPLDEQATFDVPALATEIVAELVNAAGTVQFMSAPQRDLDGYKAVPALHGEICPIRNPTDEHLPIHTYPRGANRPSPKKP